MGSRLSSFLFILTLALAFGLVRPQIVCADGQAPPSSDKPEDKDKKGDGTATDGQQPTGGQQKPPQPPAPPKPPAPPAPKPVAPAAAVAPPAPVAAQPQPPAAQPPVAAQAQPPTAVKPASAPVAAPAPVKAATPAPKAPGDEGTKPPAPGPAPAPAPMKVKITKFHFTGNSVIETAELEAIVAPNVGREFDLAELRHVADAVTEAYRARGYTVARAYIPQQEVKDGVVEIGVLEGKLGQITVQGNENYSTEFIQARLNQAAPCGVLNQASLERSLLLLNEFPDLKVTATLTQGKAPGTVDMVATAEDKCFPVSLTLDYNNYGNEGSGTSRIGAQVDWTNAVMDGATLSLRGVVDYQFDNYDYFRGSYTLPISDSGTMLGISGYWGTFNVDQFFNELNIHGDSWGGGVYVSHPCIKEREMSLSAEIGLDIKETELFMLDERSSKDAIRTAHIGANFDNTCWDGHDYASLYIYEGLGTFLGGMKDSDSDASRRNADDTFTKFYLTFTRTQYVTDWLMVMLRTVGQLTTDELVAGEQLQIGGADSVRGYQSGEVSGDNGYFVSLEPRVTLTHDCDQWYIPQIAAFIDHGGVYRRSPLIAESSSSHLTGAGVGLRWSAPYNIDVRFDVGFPIGESRVNGSDSPVFYIAGSIKF